MLQELIKSAMKTIFIALLFGLIYLINVNFIEGNIYIQIKNVSLYKLINALCILSYVVILVIFGARTAKILKSKQKLLFG